MVGDFCSIILAGGKGRRLLKEKGFLKIGEKSILERMINVLSSIGGEIMLIGSLKKKPDFLRGVRLEEDIIKDKGPIGGIYTGLFLSGRDKNLFLAWDMPFIKRELILHLLEVSNGYDAVVPVVNGYEEPLLSIYSKNCLDAVKSSIERGELNLKSFYKDVDVRYIYEDELKIYDPHLLSFFNINEMDDLLEARRIYAEHRGSPV